MAGYELEPQVFHERSTFCRMLRAAYHEGTDAELDEATGGWVP